MSPVLAIVAIVAGVALVLFAAGRLVRGTLGFARATGVSAFIVSTVFLGFDPENLAVGAVGSFEGASGIALGTVVGSAMVAIALAFGITVLAVPLVFEQAPRRILVIPILAVLLMGALSLDGELSRLDGALLLAAYLAAVTYLVWLNRQGVDVQGASVGKRIPAAVERMGLARAAGLLVLSLALLVVGSELLVRGAMSLIGQFGLSESFIGMTLIALAISIEELARELRAALKGHPEISFGNVVGSVLAFFLFNAGLIALVRPIEVDAAAQAFWRIPLLPTPTSLGRRRASSALYHLRRWRLCPFWGDAVERDMSQSTKEVSMKVRRTMVAVTASAALGLLAVCAASAEPPGSEATTAGASQRNPNDWLLNAPDDEIRFKLLQRYLRGFDQPMWEVGERFERVYDALADENYDLATYHWKKIKTTIVNGYMKRPKRQANADALFVNGVYEPVLATFKTKDSKKAWDGFNLARNICQACHEAENVGFINNQPLFRKTAAPPGK